MAGQRVRNRDCARARPVAVRAAGLVIAGKGQSRRGRPALGGGEEAKRLERAEEGDQVRLLLLGEADVEAVVVEVRPPPRGRLAEPLWKYGARGARSRSIGPLNRPMSAPLAGRSARGPGRSTLTVSPVRLVAQRVERHVGRAARRVGQADVERRDHRVVAARWACRGRSCRCRSASPACRTRPRR